MTFIFMLLLVLLLFIVAKGASGEMPLLDNSVFYGQFEGNIALFHTFNFASGIIACDKLQFSSNSTLFSTGLAKFERIGYYNFRPIWKYEEFFLYFLNDYGEFGMWMLGEEVGSRNAAAFLRTSQPTLLPLGISEKWMIHTHSEWVMDETSSVECLDGLISGEWYNGEYLSKPKDYSHSQWFQTVVINSPNRMYFISHLQQLLPVEVVTEGPPSPFRESSAYTGTQSVLRLGKYMLFKCSVQPLHNTMVIFTSWSRGDANAEYGGTITASAKVFARDALKVSDFHRLDLGNDYTVQFDEKGVLSVHSIVTGSNLYVKGILDIVQVDSLDTVVSDLGTTQMGEFVWMWMDKNRSSLDVLGQCMNRIVSVRRGWRLISLIFRYDYNDHNLLYGRSTSDMMLKSVGVHINCLEGVCNHKVNINGEVVTLRGAVSYGNGDAVMHYLNEYIKYGGTWSSSQVPVCFLYREQLLIPLALLVATEILCVAAGKKAFGMVQMTSFEHSQWEFPLVQRLLTSVMDDSFRRRDVVDPMSSLSYHVNAYYYRDMKFESVIIYQKNSKTQSELLLPHSTAQSMHVTPFYEDETPVKLHDNCIRVHADLQCIVGCIGVHCRSCVSFSVTNDPCDENVTIMESLDKRVASYSVSIGSNIPVSIDEKQVYLSAWNGLILGYPTHYVQKYCKDYRNKVDTSRKMELFFTAVSDVGVFEREHIAKLESIGIKDDLLHIKEYISIIQAVY